MELLQLECSTYQSTLPLRSSQSSVLFSQLSGFWSFTTRDQSINMVVHKFFILSLVITQALCAPSPCIESCTHQKQYQSQASNIQDHSGLSQIAAHSQGLDYSRPGTWSEHNDYDVDSGHGKVHEERGQLVEGPKTVRYYKKNYTSSYSTGYSNGAGLSEINQQINNDKHGVHIPTTDDIQHSERTYSQIGNAESITQQQRNNRIYNQHLAQSSLRRTNAQSERLEDLGEYSGNMHTIQHGASDVNTQVSQGPHNTNTDSGNWSKVDSYKTDGGHGRVFEEEGQYMSGAKKVRYYKRNFTSNYSSSDGLPISNVAKSGVLDIHKEIEKLHREIGTGLSQSSTAGTMGSSNIAQTYINAHDSSSDQLHGVNSNYRDRDNYGSSLSTGHRNEEQHFVDSANQRVLYSNPSPNNYGTNSYSTYERNERRLTKLQPSSQVINPTSGYTSVLSTGNAGYHTNRFSGVAPQQHTDNLQQAELLDTHQSKLVQNQMFLDNLRSNAHAQNSGYHSVAPGQTGNYREHWSASHTKQTSVPQYSSDISDTNQHMSQYNSNQYERRQNTHQAMQHQGSYTHQFREDGMNSARNTHLGKLITGALDLSQVGHDTVDCEQSAGHTHSHSQYQTRYKRSGNYNKQDEIEQVGSKVLDDDFSQHTGQFDDFTQQASGKLELDQESQQSYQPWKPNPTNEGLEDLTQQTSGFDDLTQQASGKLEFGQESQQSYQPWKPTPTNSKLEDLTQQTGGFDDFTQQSSGKLEFGQESQQSYEPWKPQSANQKLEDLTQQTGGFDDFTQQTSGKLEYGQESQQTYQPWKPKAANQKQDGLTQQTGGFDDPAQQTSGKLEFDQESQQSYEPWQPPSANEKLEDLTQQTGRFDDPTQQTSGKLEFGQESQQSYEPWKPQSANQKMDDLTQQTGGFDDPAQQTSGKLEFGQESQQSYEPWKPQSANQKLDDLTQQTGGFDDPAQQTSGKLEFGQESQQSYEPWKPQSANQKLDDLTQQTGGFDDPAQQTSGKLEFGQESQQSYEPWKPHSANQKLEDLIQQTGQSDDFTQQSSGKLEFGQESQQSYEPWKPQSANQKLEDLTQQTGGFDDFTQQTSGKLEYGQESQQTYQPWKPKAANQKQDGLTQQTGGFDDPAQQTSGKLEFDQESQQSYEPWQPPSANEKLEDLTQQTGRFDDPTQQTSGKLEFGQESQQSYEPWKPQSANQKMDDLTQQTGGFDDPAQQTSGKLEFGQESQQSYEPWKPQSANQKLDDLTQQTGGFDDPAQQTSGKLEFGQESQQSYEPWKPQSANQKLDDLTQQTGGFDDPAQQTSGKLEFGQESQQSYEPWKPHSANQKLEDLIQQTGQSDDFTQQSSGKLEFGQESQQSYEPWKPQSANQKLEDITQQTGGFDDFTQQTSGKLEYGQESQQSYQPWKPTLTSSKLEDLTQQTSGSDDPAQQTSGKLEFGQESQQSYEPWKPQSANQKLGDLTQQTGGFDDFTQQTSGKLEYGHESQQTYQPWESNNANHKLEVFNQKTDDLSTPQGLDSHTLKPAEKPKPKSRYSRYGSVINVQVPNQNQHTTNNQGTLDLNGADVPSIYELPPHVDTDDNTDSVRNQDRRGDQDLQSTTNGDVAKNLNERTESNGYDTEGGNVDQVNWFHKSNNDATVGLQWHYTYHPSDQRQFVQPTDQKDKEGMQQQSSEPNFSNWQQNLDRDTQKLYTIQPSNQQLGYNWPSQSQAAGEGVKTTRRNLSRSQQQNKLLTNQDSQKNSGSTESPHQLEPRILEAYGGQYDPHHSDDIYSGVTINPSATLPPTNDMDPWYIREKPMDVVTTEEPTLPPLPVESLNVDDVSVDEGSDTNETTTPANVWSRIGNKITSTFDKARERARVIFG